MNVFRSFLDTKKTFASSAAGLVIPLSNVSARHELDTMLFAVFVVRLFVIPEAEVPRTSV